MGAAGGELRSGERVDSEEDSEEDPEEDPEEEEFEEEEEVAEDGQVDEEVEEGDEVEEEVEVEGGDDEELEVGEEEEEEVDGLEEDVSEEEEVEDGAVMELQGVEEQEVDEVEVEGVGGVVNEDLQGEDREEEGENEEGEEDNGEDDDPSASPIAYEDDTAGFGNLNALGKDHGPKLTADGLSSKSQIRYKTDTGGQCDDAKDTKPLIFVESGALRTENVDCASVGEGPKKMKSDYGEKERSHPINNKEVRDIDFCALRSESKGIETAKPICSTRSTFVVEAGDVKNEKVDRACDEEGVKEMKSDYEEKERSPPFYKRNTVDIDVYPLSSETKGTETLTPLSIIGTEMAMYENSGLVITQEGGVEDMELDSEENIVHGSDVDGTVVDSVPVPVPENTALNTHHEVSGTDALSNMTVVAESLNSSTAQRGEAALNHELKVEDGGKYMNLDLKEHAVPKASRMVATSRNKRSLSFSTQLMDTNKRPAIICDYYAKGWCIKGTSCRFLHVKEDKNYTNKQLERDLASTNGEKHVGEGVGYDTKSIYQEPHAESHTRQLNVEFNYSSHEPRFLHLLKPEFSRGLVASSSAFVGRFGPSSNVTEAIDYRGNQHLFNDPLQSIADRYIKQLLPPPSTTGKFSSRQISTANGSSNSAISLSSNPFDRQKILSGGMDFNASSVSLGSRPRRDLSNSLELTLKAEMYKWEPSRPFRPSYYISIPHMSSPGSMYDPLRDGIEQVSLGVGSFKAELIHYPSHQRYPDSASEGIHFEMDKYNGAVLDKNGHPRVTGLPVAEAEVAESSVGDQGNRGIAREGDNVSGTSRRKEISETNKTNTSSAGKKNKRNKEKIHHSKQVDVDRGLDEAEQREPKTSKQFRAALVEFIKELLKPAWRDGNLSKDAHNLVVKKAAEKVLSSLHSHQVPSTPELVQQYLSSSKAKITKLVEAYVQKHNKT